MTGETLAAPLHVLYLDFDGPLHPDSVYRTRNGIELLHHPGHSLFEHVPLLEAALAPYPNVWIVLSTSWQLLEGGCEFAASHLSKSLQARCIGGTFDRRQTRKAWFESMSRPGQVLLDVCRRRPVRWVAVDDSPDEWPPWAHPHAVRTGALLGIAEPAVLVRLEARIRHQFGA